MSSSNRVRVAYVREDFDKYGFTPTGVIYTDMRKISETLSGTPTTTESAEARSDRMSSGQITTGLDVKGNVECELAGSVCFKDMILAGMKFDASKLPVPGAKGDWAPAIFDTGITATFDFVPKTASNPPYVKITAPAGSFTNILAEYVKVSTANPKVRNRIKGHILQIVNKGTAGTDLKSKNKKCIYIPNVIKTYGTDDVGEITSSSIIGFAKDMEDQTGAEIAVYSPELADIGTLDISYTIEKRFQDLTLKAITYRGSLVDTLSFNFAYGEIAKGTFGFVANGHDAPASTAEPAAGVAPATAEIALNASVDVGLVIVDQAPTAYCIQSLSLELSNNSQAQNCIGSIAPEKYTQGSAALKADMTAYLEDTNWDYIEKKIKSTPIQVCYYALNQDGGLAVNIPEIQLSFDDPATSGKDAIVELTISGTAKYSTTLEYQNSFIVYWLQKPG